MFRYEVIVDNIEVEASSDVEYQLGEKVIVKNKKKDFIAIINKLLKPSETVCEYIIVNNNDLITESEKERDQDQELVKFIQKNIEKLKLTMKIIKIENDPKESVIKIFFLSNSRVDFRDLLKILSGKYKKKIEFKQIGARDKAKMIGGLGPCGQFLCCNLYLQNFEPISINMAKNQMLALNPSKINGQCGRLLCCLSYEDESYTNAKKALPQLGSQYKDKKIEGKVVELNILKQSFIVQTNNERVEFFVKKE